jgi:hypothetical protein
MIVQGLIATFWRKISIFGVGRSAEKTKLPPAAAGGNS